MLIKRQGGAPGRVGRCLPQRRRRQARRFVVCSLIAALACAHSPETTRNQTPSDLPLQAQAEAARAREDWHTARSLYERLTQEEPQKQEHWYWLGVCALNDDDLSLADRALRQALALRDTAKAHYQLAIALDSAHAPEESVMHLRRALELDPSYGLAWRRLALALTQTGKWNEAATAVLRAHELRPDDVSVSELTGGINRMLRISRWPATVLEKLTAGHEVARQGNVGSAAALYAEVLQEHPDCAECRARLAETLRRLGRLDEAEAAYRAAINAFQPIELVELADSENNLANVLVEKGDRSGEAEAYVRRAMAIRGERPAYLDTLGRACELRQQRDCARSAYRKLLLNPTGISKALVDHARERLAKLD